MIEGTLIFCADSVLRFRSNYDDSVAIPLLSMQKVLEESAPFFLLKFFHHRVLIEEGATLASIFLAIEPWQTLLTAYLDRDVAAYISEVKKPSPMPTWDLEWIGIYHSHSINRAYEHTAIEEGEDLASYLNRERIPIPEFHIENTCDASGFVKNHKERYSISGDIHEIKKLPVILYHKQVVSASFDSENQIHMFQADILGVHTNKYSSFIVGEADFVFYQVMEALFISGLFYDTPQVAKNKYEEVKEIAESLKETQENQSINQSLDLCSDDNTENKPMKIEIAEGAFDSLIAHEQQEAEYWQYIKEQCKKEQKLPIRIGSITEAVAPELYLNGQLF